MLKYKQISVLCRFFSNIKPSKPKVCVVGAGPAGFYAAQHLVKKLGTVEIDIFERLPVPFGLVRFGVAPDHPEVKNVINTFTKTAENKSVRFCGNVSLGRDISLADLRRCYHIVVLTYGAEENRQLNIPGEDLFNVIPARKIVGWYNGLPSDKDLKIDLNCENVAIVGQGNVAVDVARILLSPVDDLRKTDITQHALDQISKSKIKKIHLIGRRGPLQAAFTIKELREMLKLKGCLTQWNSKDFEQIDGGIIDKLSRPKKRIIELMLKSVQEQSNIKLNTDDLLKTFNPKFFRSPLQILGETKVESLILGINRLEGIDILGQRAVRTDKQEILPCELVISSIGYKSLQADPSIPFDSEQGIILNDHGKVASGLYTSGWLGTGPIGVILTTMSSAFGVAERIIEDIQKYNLLDISKPGFSEMEKILDKRNVQFVDWMGWEKINRYEVSQGEKLGKPREKIIDINKMLDIASS